MTKKADSTPAANLELTVTDPRPDVEKKVKDRVKTNERAMITLKHPTTALAMRFL